MRVRSVASTLYVSSSASVPLIPHIRALQRCGEDGGGPSTRLAVPERDRARGAPLVEQGRDLADPVGAQAEQGVRAELDRDRALGRVAQREARDAERRRLFLDPAGVREHELRLRLEPEEVEIPERG